MNERRHFLKITLRTKLIAFTVFLVFIIMANTTYFFTIREINLKRTSMASQYSRIAQNIATMQLMDRQDWATYQDYIDRLITFNQDIVYIAIYDERNTLRAHALNQELVELDRPLLNRRSAAMVVQQLDQGQVADESQNDIRSVHVNIMIADRIIGSVHIGFSIIEINHNLKNGIALNIGLAALFVIVFSFLAYFISRRLTRPLEELSEAMEAVNAGDFSQTVKTVSHDEIGELSRAFNRMLEKMRERQIIDKLGYELSSIFQLGDLAAMVSQELANAIGAAAARLYIEDKFKADVFFEITSKANGNKYYPPLHLTPAARQYLLQNSTGFMIDSVPDPIRQILNHQENQPNGFVIPMLVKGDVFGMLFFELPKGLKEFTDKQKEFALTLSIQAIFALENAFLYEKLSEQERIKRELEIAREMQQKLLPTQMPRLSGFEIDAICRSAREVGGDYFDFFQLKEQKIGIAVADVSGKGTSASFYMAQIKGMMLQLSSSFPSPRKLLCELNRNLYGSIERQSFVTMIYGILDTKSKKIRIARAGHNSFVKIGLDQHYDIYSPNGIGLGLDSGPIFNREIEEIEIQMRPGDSLVFYTDGVTEAMNSAEVQFGEERLLETLLKAEKLNVVAKRDRIMQSLEQFLNGSKPHDDITLVIIDCITKK